MGNVWALAVVVMLLNVPFGLWRAGTRKFTAIWFVAVHSPVPVVVVLRYWTGLGWSPATFAVLGGAFFAGQLLGGRLRRDGPRGP